MRSVLFDVDAGGGKSKIHAVSLHDVHDVQVQVVLHLQKLGVDVGQQVGRDQDVDAGISEAGQLHDVGAVVGEGACIQHGLQVLHQLFQLRAGGAVGDTQREFVGAHGAQGGVLHGGRADLTVRHHIDGFIQRADAGGTGISSLRGKTEPTGIQKYWGYRRYPQYRIKNPPAVQNRRCRLHEDTCRCFVL